MNNFIENCRERFEKVNSVLCLGLDPVIEKFPIKNDGIEKTIVGYFTELISNFHGKILAVKPNMAFYEQYGIEGYSALKKVVELAANYGLPVILDAKRGDIGNTSLAYARACFDELKADAVTLSPYLGEDSLSPFFGYKDKGFFVLDRTSNKGSSDFQLLKTENGGYLYSHVTEKIVEWNKKYSEGIGAVAGATHIEEFGNIAGTFSENGFLPILIPGVGTQGGDLGSVVSKLKNMNYPLYKIFINSSSKIIFAHNEHGDMKYIDAVEYEINKMQL
jgi:orotidine-5'-phosphate decarboxylase